MNSIKIHKRSILNRKDLQTKILKVSENHGVRSHTGRSEVLRVVSKSLSDGRAAIKSYFEKGISGSEASELNAFFTDQLLRTIYEIATLHAYKATNPTDSERLVVVAIGGYGRSQMAPFSDIDLLFLSPFKLTAWGEQVIEYILYMLWDLGLRVGHSVRSVSESVRVARYDITIFTSMLEARYVCGDRKLFDSLQIKFLQDIKNGNIKNFIESKISELQSRHKKFGDNRYLVEPNIKDGKGGLRDLHTLIWLSKYFIYKKENYLSIQQILTPAEVFKFNKTQEFLWRVRFWLHYTSGYAEEHLSFEVQNKLSEKLSYRNAEKSSRVERFMKYYYLNARNVGDLARIFFTSIDVIQRKKRKSFFPKIGKYFSGNIDGFKDIEGALTITDENIFINRPIEMVRIFAVAQNYSKDNHPAAFTLMGRNLYKIRLLRNNPEANKTFLNIITSRNNPEETLRRMNESGFLGRFIPDFGRIVAQTQHDMYHVYTVDEHTIRAIGVLHKIESGDLVSDHPLATSLIRKIVSRRVLYISVLLHDIAKGRGGDHSVIGENISSKLCPRLGLNKTETEDVCWLVRWHLLLSRTAFKRDLEDIKIILDLAKFINENERLNMLFILTVVDIRAVGPNRWNAWKGQLLRTLYHQVSGVLTGSLNKSLEEKINFTKKNLRLALEEWSAKEFDEFENNTFDSHWLSLDIATLERQAHLAKKSYLQKENFSFSFHIDDLNAVTELTIYTKDNPGLFTKLAGAFALTGVNVVDAKVNTMKNGMALDTFWIQSKQLLPFQGSKAFERLKNNINNSLKNEKWLKDSMENTKLFLNHKTNQTSIEPNVAVDNYASTFYTVVEVTTKDRIRLLYDLSNVFAALEIQIGSSHITTYGERVVDVFYIKDIFGLKILHKKKLEILKKSIFKVIN